MTLITSHDGVRLLANGQLRRKTQRECREAVIDFVPVVKLVTSRGTCTWLLTEIDQDDTDRAFGLCDLGLGFPELGTVSLSELTTLPVERDAHFAGQKSWAQRWTHAATPECPDRVGFRLRRQRRESLAGLKIRRPQGLESSSLSPGTGSCLTRSASCVLYGVPTESLTHDR